jgi:hypothetical protein
MKKKKNHKKYKNQINSQANKLQLPILDHLKLIISGHIVINKSQKFQN